MTWMGTTGEIERPPAKRLSILGSTGSIGLQALEVAEKLCDKIAIIKNGRLVKSGPTQELVGDSDLESVFLELEGEKE